MISSAVALLLASVSTIFPLNPLPPVTDTIPVAPRAVAPDTRVNLWIDNPASMFRDIRIGDKTYTILPHHVLSIKALPGTPIISDCNVGLHKRDQLVLVIDASLNGKHVHLD